MARVPSFGPANRAFDLDLLGRRRPVFTQAPLAVPTNHVRFRVLGAPARPRAVLLV